MTSAEDEVGDLVRAFSEMQARLAARTREREQAEETLRESEERYRGIVETAQEGVWVLDRAANTSFANAKMGEMLGRPADELTDISLFDFIAPEDRAGVVARIRAWGEGASGQQEFRLRRADGGSCIRFSRFRSTSSASSSPHRAARHATSA